jgi:hypothetical protein
VRRELPQEDLRLAEEVHKAFPTRDVEKRQNKEELARVSSRTSQK